ncbi:hypothetical protein DE4585_02032 [Mycobacteroides salmoniphilum]|uniref:FHA domain-containing protein n=1 Tax=Mycobacteroides salmoniphilum TaxID=404941 RepID=A0A4R8S8M2_9MYCO|nr:hypothetical protein [Mycobacteroides salmoniphilum]TDZ83237.1 hypothetical protein DE4585_02032 [Mycobacteroides salmoniphilum]
MASKRDENHLSEETVVIEPPPAQLLVIIGDDTHIFHPSAQSVVVGVGGDGSIQIAPDSLPGPHVVLRKTGTYWIGEAIDHEILVDGRHQSSFYVVEPVTCRFPGQDRSVTFLTESHRRGQTIEVDPGTLRAGIAAAQHLDHQGLTPLVHEDATDPPWTARYANTETWPDEKLLTQLERAYGWPVGTLKRIRDGQEPPASPGNAGTETTDLVVSTGQVPLMVNTAQLALQTILPRIDTLPDPNNPDLPARADAIAADLRRVEELCRRAAKHSHGVPEFVRILSDVRRAYRKVMLVAAQSRGAYLSQRLYAARHHSGLTVEEIAMAAAVPTDAVTAAETGTGAAPADEVALTHLLNYLTTALGPAT